MYNLIYKEYAFYECTIFKNFKYMTKNERNKKFKKKIVYCFHLYIRVQLQI